MYIPTPTVVSDLTVTNTQAYNWLRGLPGEILTLNRQRQAPHDTIFSFLCNAVYQRKAVAYGPMRHETYRSIDKGLNLEGGWARHCFAFPDRSHIVLYANYGGDATKPTMAGTKDFAFATSEEYLNLL